MHSTWSEAADEYKCSWASLCISGIGLLSQIYSPAERLSKIRRRCQRPHFFRGFLAAGQNFAEPDIERWLETLVRHSITAARWPAGEVAIYRSMSWLATARVAWFDWLCLSIHFSLSSASRLFTVLTSLGNFAHWLVGHQNCMWWKFLSWKVGNPRHRQCSNIYRS